MEQNEVNTQEKSVVTIQNSLRGLAMLCLIFVFCPTFFVSCSGEDIHVSAFTAIKGTSAYGEQLIKPYPIMLICIILPVVALVFLWKSSMADKQCGMIITACGCADFIIWIIFALVTKKKAEECYCEFGTTIWYWLNLLAILLLISISLLVFLEKKTMGSQLKDLLSKEMSDTIAEMTHEGVEKSKKGIGSVSNWVSEKVGQHPNSQELNTYQPTSQPVTAPQASTQQGMDQQTSIKGTISYCCECGNRIKEGQKFCAVCGTKIQQDN